MRAVLTRVSSASVAIDGQTVGSIGKGFLILLGVGPNDTEKECRYLAEKALGLRVFKDENDKMNLSIRDIDGEALVISQFTLLANYKHGNRPDFLESAKPEEANRLYEYFKSLLSKELRRVESGIFGADMKVSLTNDGPVTICMDSDVLKKKN